MDLRAQVEGIELEPVSRQNPVRLAYVDTVEIRRLAP